MIPQDFIDEWGRKVNWITADQVEQDLIISRALVEIYSDPYIASKLAFRGGTALHKVHLVEPLRYSEDIDFIQIDAEPIGKTFDAIRNKLDPWLGKPKRELGEGLVKLQYRYQSTERQRPMRVKVEINSREHFAARELSQKNFKVNSRWFSGEAKISILKPGWMLGSKMRALYGRKKGRDLFDLAISLHYKLALPEEIVASFLYHLKEDDQMVTRAEFEENLYHKMHEERFLLDLAPLLPEPKSKEEFQRYYELILQELISRLPGSSWRGTKEEAKRKKRTIKS